MPDFLLADSLANQRLKASIQIMKIYGESESSCLIPLVGLNNPLGSSLTITEQDTEEIHSFIEVFHIGGKSIS